MQNARAKYREPLTPALINGLSADSKEYLVFDQRVPFLGIRVATSGKKTFTIYKRIRGHNFKYSVGTYPEISVERARSTALEILNRLSAKVANTSLSHDDVHEIIQSEIRRMQWQRQNSVDEPILQLVPDGSTDNEPAGITFGELFELYYAKHAVLRTKRPENARYFFSAHGPRWKDVPVSKIKRRDLQDWVDELGARSRSSATRAIDMVSIIINWGLKREYVTAMDNPCKGVDRFVIKSRERFLSPEEMVRLKQSLDQEEPIIRHFFWMCLLTGARRGNVLAMRWADIDTTLATWTIPHTEHKNGETQCIALTDAALLILLERRKVTLESEPWVFPSRKKSVSGHMVEVKRVWERVLERADISNARIHDLRRTVGSYMALKGADGFLIAKALGHKDLRSTQVYARLNLEPVRNALNNIQAQWDGYLANPDQQP